MICIGIPVCRPLYKRYLDKWTSRDASNYQERSGGGSYPLKTFGGSTLRPRPSDRDNSSEGGDSITLAERKLGIGGPYNKSFARAGGRVRGDDQSEESILGPDFRRSQHRNDLDAQEKGEGITVTEEFQITTSRLNV